MKHRSMLPEKERRARSRAAQLLHDSPIIVGGLVEMARTCGKPTCKCTAGEKHKSWYLSLRHKGKRKMIHVPRDCEEEIFKGIKAYQEVWEYMTLISEASLDRIITFRKRKE